MITLALAVLNEAACRSSREPVRTPGVCLALRVLLPYVADRSGLLAFWECAASRAPHPRETYREPYYRIARGLRNAGWEAPPVPTSLHSV